MRARRRKGRGGDGGASGLQGEGPNRRLWAHGMRAGRTVNMLNTVATLVVSKLSGWLNTNASCRVERRAYKPVSRGAGKKKGGAWGDAGASGWSG